MPENSKGKSKREVSKRKPKKVKFVKSDKKPSGKFSMKKPGIVPGKVSPTKSSKVKTKTKEKDEAKDKASQGVVLTDENIVPMEDADSVFSNTMIEDVHEANPRTIVQAEPREASEMFSEDADLEFLSDQVSAYLELSEVVDKGGWKPNTIIDLVDVFARAVNFESVSIALLDHDEPGTFGSFVSRGIHNFPSQDTIDYLQKSIEDGYINWDKILKLASRKVCPFQDWVRAEIFEFIAFVPIHDGRNILGFILAASRKKHQPSDIASNLLELLGGRLGLSLTAHPAGK